MSSAPLFITIDTEGDALWDNPKEIRTENVLCIPRFQELCEKYGFIPIWLTDYEIIEDKRYVDYIRPKAQAGKCEVGIHVHARNNPPLYILEGEAEIGAAFLNEYPPEIMRDKFLFLKETIEQQINISVKTHRAGRWALNQQYIDLLIACGVQYDCSVTPGINWSNTYGIVSSNRGTDYTDYKNGRQSLTGSDGNTIVEYPVSVLSDGHFIKPDRITPKSLLRSFYHSYKKTPIWLRPNTNGNLEDMKYVLRTVKKQVGYAEFMIHSSELMPGGGPHHQGKEEVDYMFRNIELLFEYAVSIGFSGYTFDGWEKKKI